MTTRPPSYDFLFKILVVGDPGVGKSHLLSHFGGEKTFPSPLSGIGLDFRVNTLIIDDQRVKIQMWDTPLTQRYSVRGLHCLLLLYDVTNETSFQNISTVWWDQIEKVRETATIDFIIILIGTKNDNGVVKIVETERGQILAAGKRIDFFEISVKDDICTDETYIRIATILKTRFGDGVSTDVDGARTDAHVDVDHEIKQQKTGCGII